MWKSAFGMSRSTATGILQLMEKNGLILRESVASDARLKSLIPTEKAADLDAQVGECLRQTEQRLTSGPVQRAAGAVSGNRRTHVRKPGRNSRRCPQVSLCTNAYFNDAPAAHYGCVKMEECRI